MYSGVIKSRYSDVLSQHPVDVDSCVLSQHAVDVDSCVLSHHPVDVENLESEVLDIQQ